MTPYAYGQATADSVRELRQRVKALTTAHRAEHAARTAAEQRARTAAAETARVQAALHAARTAAEQRARTAAAETARAQAATAEALVEITAEREDLRERLRVAEQHVNDYAERYERATNRVSQLQAALEDEQKVQVTLRNRIRTAAAERDRKEKHHLRTLADLYQARLATAAAH